MLGWRSGGFAWWQYAVVLVGFAFDCDRHQSAVSPEQDNDLFKSSAAQMPPFISIAFIATFTAPFVEEVVYRGVVYSAFQRAMGVPAAFLVTTFLFAVRARPAILAQLFDDLSADAAQPDPDDYPSQNE